MRVSQGIARLDSHRPSSVLHVSLETKRRVAQLIGQLREVLDGPIDEERAVRWLLDLRDRD